MKPNLKLPGQILAEGIVGQVVDEQAVAVAIAGVAGKKVCHIFVADKGRGFSDGTPGFFLTWARGIRQCRIQVVSRH